MVSHSFKSNGCTMLYQKDQLTEMKLGRSNVLTKQHLSVVNKICDTLPKRHFYGFPIYYDFAIFYILHNFTVS